ncbi:MAG: hypothetical protein D6681_02430 [Calditrichaeota bacterium]|nr:MAG: hypothetical protein D6681_02430 [Calditrichota bacterium]
MRRILIWVLVIGYFLVLFYIFWPDIKPSGEEPEQPVTETPVPPSDTLTGKLSDADALLNEVYDAVDQKDYDRAAELSRELAQRYPGSRHAELALNLSGAAEPGTLTEREISRRRLAPPPTPPSRPPETQPQKPAEELTRIAPPSRPVPQAPATPEARVQQALSRVRAVPGEQRGLTYYYNRNVSHFLYKNSLEAYIGQNEKGNTWLKLRIYYTGPELLNIHTFEIYADDRSYVIPVVDGSIHRGVGEGGAYEWFDMRVGPKELTVLRILMHAGRTAIRYIGENGRYERILREDEKVRLQNILEAYEALKARQSFLSTAAGPAGSQ